MIFYPDEYLKKVLPKGFWRKNLITNSFEVKKQTLRALTTARLVNGREIEGTIYKTLSQYEYKYEALREAGVDKRAAFVDAVNDEALLKQRLENTVVYDEIQSLKEEHSGEFYIWLPSNAEKPDPEHQLLYGKIFRVGEGDKDGYMPGERYGCKCGIEFLGNAAKDKALASTDKKFIKDAERMYNRALGTVREGTQEEVTFRTVGKKEAAILKKVTGLNLEGYEHKLKLTDVRHIAKQHGSFAREAARGQVAVKAKDLALIPEITKNFDSVALSSKRSVSGQQILIYRKRIGTEYYYLEGLGSKGKKELTPKTMFIKKK